MILKFEKGNYRWNIHAIHWYAKVNNQYIKYYVKIRNHCILNIGM